MTTFEIRGWEAEVRTVPSKSLSKMFPPQKDIFVRRAGSDLPATCIAEDFHPSLWNAETVVSRYVDALERFSVSIEKRLHHFDPHAPEAEKQGLLTAAQRLLEGSLVHYHLSYGLVVGETFEILDYQTDKKLWKERSYKAGDEAVFDIRYTHTTLLNNHSSNTTEWIFGNLYQITPFWFYFNAVAPPYAEQSKVRVKPLHVTDFLRRNLQPVDLYSREPQTTRYWTTSAGDRMVIG